MFTNLNTFKVLKELFVHTSKKSSMRDLAKITGLSVATVSKVCSDLGAENLIKTEKVAKSLLVSANIGSKEYTFFKRLFNIYSLKDLIFQISGENPSAVILYGSYSRGEDDERSDIDIAVIGAEFEVGEKRFEKSLFRSLHIMFFASEKDIPDDLRISLNNGIVLLGGLL